MDQFIHLPEFQVIVCKKCQYAVLPNEINSHFTKTPSHGLSKRNRRHIKERVARVEGLIKNQKELAKGFVFPPPTAAPISALEPPKIDGLRCTFENNGERCQYVNRQEQPMRKHCKDVHDWINPQKKGRPRGDQDNSEKKVPWEKGVHCQRFFAQGMHSNYFAVQKSQGRTRSIESPEDKAQKDIQNRIDKAKELERRKIEISDKAQEPSPWLRRVRWDHHLQSKDKVKVRELIQPVDPEEEELSIIHNSFDRIMDECQKHVVEEAVGEATLFMVNATEYGKKGENPFYMDMKENTHSKYRGYWKQMLSFVVRGELKWSAEDRPHYRFTRDQRTAFDKLISKAKEFQGVEIGEEMSKAAKQQMTELDSQCLRFCIKLLDHQLVSNPYDNAIISGLSILGIKENGKWKEAIEYTTIYSAIIKVARALVVEQAHREWCKSISANKASGMDEDQAIEWSESPYQLVKPMVNKFMGLAGGRRDPSPMDWIISKRTYGMKIRSNTPADGKISWIGDKIIGYNLEFNMGQLQTTVHSVVANARMILMRDLIMVPLDANGDINEGRVPPVNWDSLRDNMAESKVGWSFLNDVRNTFSVDGQWWLFKQVLHRPTLKSRFVQSMEPLQWRQQAMKQYEQHLVRFQELLLFCCHFAGGQPSRAPEILSVRHRNTASGGIRNVGVENGLMFFVPKTHKNYMQTGNIKVVHHWLPKEVGELMLYYLWLVLPFWERVQISVDENVKWSPFIWGKPVLETKKADRGEPDEGEPNEGESGEGDPGEGESNETDEPQDDIIETIDNEVYVKVGSWHKEWASSRLRAIIQREFMQGISVKMNINAWRNMAEAISQKFLRHPFEFDEDEEWKDEGDEIWEEQFGHSAAIGEKMYGRLVTEAPDERGSRRAKFRVISHEWHQFLQFPSARHKIKATRSVYDEAMHSMQIRRRQYIKDIDVQQALEGYMGEGTQFRGEQKKAITAIMKGKSPILIVMGTGTGKSLLFMLPAFCVQGGTSIVVVPLQSLQTDLKGRCDKDSITCAIWRVGQAIEPTSIVLVTPESALTESFRDFINLLRATHRLDRVFIDECHSVLASSATFRPTMRHLGELVRVGTQVVFLTATLRPRSEEQFCQSMNIIGRGVVKIREPTTRKNIKYQIRTYQRVWQKGSKDDGIIAAVVQVVEELKIKYPAPAKIIVYSRVITQAEELSKVLGCMLYHATVDGRDGKDKRLKKWQSGEEESRVAVATNAMGLGINTGDTRGVVHAGMPEDLADYAQESGRGGRDGLPSEAIVVLPAAEEPAAKIRRGINSRVMQQSQPGPAVVYRHKKDQPPTKEENEQAAEVEEFVHGKCRRVALDQTMDGNFKRNSCMPDEEACDLCNVCQQEVQDESLAAFDDQQCQPRQDDTPQQVAQDEMTFSQQDQERNWIDFHVRERERQEAYEVEELERQLDHFNNRCAYCYVHGIPSTTHSINRCTTQGVQVVQQGVQEFVQKVQDKRSFERFSCCLYCYVPQAICQRWKQKEKDGRWEEDRSKDCQYKNVIIPAFWSMVIFGGEQEMDWLCRWAEEDGYNIRDPDEEVWWFGKKVEWGGIEGNNLIKAFGIIARRFIEAIGETKQ